MKQKLIKILPILIICGIMAAAPIKAEEPVIYFTYLFNWNLNHAGAPVSDIPLLVEQGHNSLLDLFEKHSKWTTQFYPSAFTSEYLQKNYPETIKRLKKGLEEGRYGIGTYTVSHPILNLTPYKSLVLQLQTSMAHDQQLWGFKPKSVFLPENAWDVVLPQVWKDVGLEWISLYKELVPAFENELFYPATIMLEGVNGTKIPAVVCSHYLSRGSADDIKAKLDSLHAILKEKGIKEHFVAFKGDAEDIYFGSRSILRRDNSITLAPGQKLPELPAFKEWDERLQMVEDLPYAKFMKMDDWLAKHPPVQTVPPEEISMSADFTNWIRNNGVERINILTDEARREVSQATYTILLAEKLGLDVANAKKILEQAEYQLMLSEGADGRATRPPASRKVFVMEAAVNATKLARKAVDAIPAK
ncbi:hypothetical protein JXQ31_17810 [candidate division KSB1 bacterium]|nr:hypothetical protein [candidate division KSB1 bacterium]